MIVVCWNSCVQWIQSGRHIDLLLQLVKQLFLFVIDFTFLMLLYNLIDFGIFNETFDKPIQKILFFLFRPIFCCLR